MMITACVAILISAHQFNDNKKPSEMTLVVNDTVGGLDGIIAAHLTFSRIRRRSW
jgi:rod shape-determining protein MreC